MVSDAVEGAALATMPSLYGFSVRTEVPLRFLRSGGGRETLEIVAATNAAERPSSKPLAEWDLKGTAYAARASLYRSGDHFEFWTTDTGRFVLDLDRGTIELPATSDEVLREQRLCGVPMILAYAHRGDFSLHAASVEVGGGAVILAGPSRFGKSTLSFAFHRLGYRVLGEDLICCRTDPAQVLPGPALLRVRPDVYDGSHVPGATVVVTRPDRVYLALDQERRGTSAPVPLKGIVFLRLADELKIEPVAPAHVIADLWHLNFRLATVEDRTRSFHQLTRLAGSVPTWNVHRPMRLDTLEATVEAIREQIEKA